MPFFPYFSRKSHCSLAHILSKKRPFSKNTLFSCQLLFKNTSIFSKTQCFNFIFFKFFIENPCFYANIWSKTPTMSKPHYLSEKKSVGCLFRNFHEKPKKRPYFKKQTFLSQKKRPFSQKHCAHMQFVSNIS